jgi:uncharacterized protein (TIGR03545 family)
MQNMTQSPTNPPTHPAPKIAKAKGPIRFEAVIPIAIIILVIGLYFKLFFDHHLKMGLEYVGTHANGAEVDIGSVHTSFFDASLKIENIQVTDLEKPELNKIQISEVRWQMLWDALLRAKIVIHEASILGIQISSKRSQPGHVLPKDPPSESKLEKLSNQALDNAEKEFSGNVFGDVAGLLNGADPKEQLKNIEANLKSEARIKQLQGELDTKQKEYKDRLAKLPQSKDIQDLQVKIKTVKTSGFSNPQELQTSIQQIDSIIKDANNQYKSVKETSDALTADLNKYQQMPKEIEALVQSDIKDLEARLKIPKLDVDTLAKVLFGPSTLAKLKQGQFYMNKARQYIPPKQTAEQKADAEAKKLKPEQRSKGKNYKFGRPRAYPLFWLQTAALSSKSSDAEFSGDMKGELKNLTDDQSAVGAPTTLSFQGDFPKQQLFGVHGLLSIDHRGEEPIESLNLKVDTIKVADKALVNSPDVQIGFKSAAADSNFKLEFKGANVDLNSSTDFQKIDYTVGAKQAILDDILKNAFKDIPKVNVIANVKGPWSALRFNIDTNLAHDLQKAFEKQIQHKIGEAQAQLKALVDNRIGAERAKLMAEFNKIQEQVKSQLGAKQAEIDKAKAQLEDTKNQAAGDQKKKLEDLGKQKLNDLKKQFGF